MTRGWEQQYDYWDGNMILGLGASTTTLGSLFQCLTTSKSSKVPFPRILPLVPREEISAPHFIIPLLKKLQRATRSPLNFLLFKLDKPKVPSHSSQFLTSSPFICFLAFHWMHSRTFTSFLNSMPQNCTQRDHTFWLVKQKKVKQIWTSKEKQNQKLICYFLCSVRQVYFVER